MSQNPYTADSSTNYQVIFDDALKSYETKTGKDLKSDPLLRSLENCHSPDAVLTLLRLKIPGVVRSGSSDDRLTNWVNPVVNVLYNFSQMIGGAVALTYPPAGVIFTGISFLLSAVLAASASQGAVIDLFERIENFFIRLGTYVGLPPTAEITDIIVKVMIDVLLILALVTREIQQGKMKKFLKILIGRSDIKDALQRFDKLTQEESRMVVAQGLKVTHGVGNDVRVVGDGVEVAINKVDAVLDCGENMRVELQQVERGVSDIAKDASDEKRNQMRRDIENWLSPADPSLNLNIASDAHHEGTAEWFTQSSAFMNWKESGSLLWIHGKPGSGKSVLSATIINNICNNGTGHLAFFFFDFKDAGKQDARALLSSIIVQLSDRSVGLFDVLLGFYSAHRDGKQQPSISALTQCFEDMLKVPEELPIYLITDAIDECPNTTGMPSSRDQVLALLERLVTLRLPNLRICVTSRLEADIQTLLEPLTSTSNMISLHDESGQKKDIIDFVTSVVRSDRYMRRWREADKELVINTLSEKADGMFRWIFCQLKMLRPCLPSSVQGILAELPETLDATYERILQEIPKSNRVHAHRLLQCLSVAARPPKVEEIAEVFAIEFDVMGGIPKLTGDFRWENQEQAVLSACSSLIIIVNHRGSRRVQFSHFSVKEFLSSDRLATSETAALRFHHIHFESAHAIMAQACLGVLLQLDDSMDKKTIEGYPLAKYAGEFFDEHAKAGDVLSQNNEGANHLLDPDRPHFNPWLWLQCGDIDQKDLDLNLDSSSELDGSSSEHSFPTYPPRISALYYTVRLELPYLTRHLILNRPHDLDASDVYGGTPLHFAVCLSDFEATRLLLERTADINARDNRGLTPLHYAVSKANRRLKDDLFRCFRLLLESGADAEAQNDRGSTPLHLAASNMSLKFVQILLENVTNINLRNDQGQTALHEASRRGDTDIISIILNHGAYVDAQDSGGSTPLHLAFSNARLWDAEQAIGVLLEHGANINLQNHEGQTALHKASRFDDIDVIHLILRHSPDVNALDNNGSTPLHLAISAAPSWHLERAVGLLLEHGTNINLQDGEGQTALHKASLHGYPNMVQLILDHGADVDAQDNDGLTPLHLILSKVSMDSEASEDSEACEESEAFEPFEVFEASEVFEAPEVFETSEVFKAPKVFEAPVVVVNSREVMKLLLKHGASSHRENNRGETPFQVAAARGHQEITKLLSNHLQSERMS